jgi:hypothetical protein
MSETDLIVLAKGYGCPPMIEPYLAIYDPLIIKVECLPDAIRRWTVYGRTKTASVRGLLEIGLNPAYRS